MKPNRFYTYTVKADLRYTSFPLDMLRYDQAWPADPDAVAIIDAPLEERLRRREVGPSVRLNSYSRPTDGRWSSFGWTVVEITERAV